MEKSFQIRGITRFEYPVLYAVLERNMKTYNITKIKVKILEHGVIAGARSFPENYLQIPKKLLQILNDEELEVIVAHEFSHIFNRDSFIGMGIIVLFSIPLFIIAAFYFITLIKIKHLPNITFSVLFFVLLIFSIYIYNIGLKTSHWVSVQQEIRSDWEALLKTKNPEALKNALFKLEIEPFTTSWIPRYFEIVFMCFNYISLYFHGQTHPVLKERLEYLELAERMLEAQGSEMERR